MSQKLIGTKMVTKHKLNVVYEVKDLVSDETEAVHARSL